MKDLYGNVAIKFGVKTLVDVSHSAAANEALDGEVVDSRRGC